jgi:glycosyltransferase involved in cell wall biosynthesis
VLTLVDKLFDVGGAERLAIQIPLNLDRERFEPFVCSTRQWPRPAYLEELREAQVPTLMLERRSVADLLPWRRLVGLLRRERIDVVHAHQFGSNVWGTLFGRATGVPVVVAHEHTWSFEGAPLRKLLDRRLIGAGANAFIAVSPEDRRRMIEIERVPEQKIRLIPNGIPPLCPSGHDVRAELGIAAGAPVVGTVAVLRPQKALEILIAAAERLRTRFPDIRVVVAGSGPEEQRLRELAAARGVADVVLFLGLRHDIADVLAAFDVAVICSDFEGTPLAVVEYMAAGLPVVATPVGGVPQLVEEGTTGLFVPTRDPAALADAVAALIADPERRARMGASARKRQRAERDLSVTVRRVEELYEELFSRTRRARDEGWSPAPR